MLSRLHQVRYSSSREVKMALNVIVVWRKKRNCNIIYSYRFIIIWWHWHWCRFWLVFRTEELIPIEDRLCLIWFPSLLTHSLGIASKTNIRNNRKLGNSCDPLKTNSNKHEHNIHTINDNLWAQPLVRDANPANSHSIRQTHSHRWNGNE